MPSQRYPLHELDSDEFETLSALICEKILGTGVVVFSKGKDGGRDGSFSGTANNYPDKQKPWNGKFVIQAKHTRTYNASCSDAEFTSILNNEIKSKLPRLINNNLANNYLVFTNRKMSGLQDVKVSDLINEEIKINNAVFGEEKIQFWLRAYTEIPKILKLNNLFLPFQFFDEDLKSIVIKFSEISKDLAKTSEDKKSNFDLLDLEEKNRLNQLSKEYFDYMKANSVSQMGQIDDFLTNPKNLEYNEMYQNTISDLQEKIIIYREEYNKFDEILVFLYDFIKDNHLSDIKNQRKLIKIFLHYMYFNCDIGIKK